MTDTNAFDVRYWSTRMFNEYVAEREKERIYRMFMAALSTEPPEDVRQEPVDGEVIIARLKAQFEA